MEVQLSPKVSGGDSTVYVFVGAATLPNRSQSMLIEVFMELLDLVANSRFFCEPAMVL